MSAGQRLATVRTGVIAGAAGGLAEILWVIGYTAATGTDPAIIARGVTTAAGVTSLLPASAVGLGVALHMLIAASLGVALAFMWNAINTTRLRLTQYPLTLAALAAVWTINFFIVLPIVSPDFVHIVPYAVSLTSKLLFGIAAAEAFRNANRLMVRDLKTARHVHG